MRIQKEAQWESEVKGKLATKDYPFLLLANEVPLEI